MDLSELLLEIRARCPNNWKLQHNECEELILKYAKRRINRKLKTNKQVRDEIITLIDVLLLDGDLSDDQDDVLIEAQKMIEGLDV
jgi:predicted outer membrane protein